QSAEWVSSWRGTGPADPAALPSPDARPLAGGDERYSGTARAGSSFVFLSQQFDGRWRLEPTRGGAPVPPGEAFGWAVGFASAPGSAGFKVQFHGQGVRTAEVALL